MLKSLKLRIAAILALPAFVAAPALAQGVPQSAPGIILFEGSNFSGDSRELYDVTPEMPYIAFNDRTKSIVVLGGVWEVCQHSDFRGRCVVVRQDVRDLREFRLNRAISSVRPIYEVTDAQHGLMFNRRSDGSIRYLDDYFDNYAGYDRNYGYDRSSLTINFGFSDHYRNYGYYHPRLGYGPYGYGFRRVGHPNAYRRGYRAGYGHGTHRPRVHRPRVHRPNVDRRPDRRRPVVDRRPDRRPDVERRRPDTDRRRPRDVARDDRRRPDRRRPDRRRPELDGGNGGTPVVDRPRRRDPGVDRPPRRPVADTQPRRPRTDRPNRRDTGADRPNRPRVDRPRRERPQRAERQNRRDRGGAARTRGQVERRVDP